MTYVSTSSEWINTTTTATTQGTFTTPVPYYPIGSIAWGLTTGSSMVGSGMWLGGTTIAKPKPSPQTQKWKKLFED